MATNKKPEPNEVFEFIKGQGFEYKEKGDEIMFPCLNGCDDDDRESEKYHCSINTETGQYHCFKCNASGNLVTLRKDLGISKIPTTRRRKSREDELMSIAKKCHEDFMKNSELRNNFMERRRITLVNMNRFLLGVGEFYGKKMVHDSYCRTWRVQDDQTSSHSRWRRGRTEVYDVPKRCGINFIWCHRS